MEKRAHRRIERNRCCQATSLSAAGGAYRRIEEPDWAGVHRELKRKHVALTILRDEYIAENSGGYS